VKFERTYKNPLSGPGISRTIPTEMAGEIASWIINNQCDSPSKIAVFLTEEHQLIVSTKTVSRFLQEHGLDKILQKQPTEESVGRTKFLGGWLLIPYLLSLLRRLFQQIFFFMEIRNQPSIDELTSLERCAFLLQRCSTYAVHR